MSFLIRRQEDNKNQTVSHNQKPPCGRGPSLPPGHPIRKGETPAFQGHREEFLFGGVRENQRGLRIDACSLVARGEGSWFPGELVSKWKKK